MYREQTTKWVSFDSALFYLLYKSIIIFTMTEEHVRNLHLWNYALDLLSGDGPVLLFS